MTSRDVFELWLQQQGFTLEHRFHPTRRWRFDWANLALRIAVEIEGGTWAGGRHARGSGYDGDCEKYNEAAIFGWTVLRFTTSMINKGGCADVVRRAIEAKGV